MIILIHLQDRPKHFNQIRKKSSGPEWAIWHPTPEWLPASFHSTAGLTGFLKWAKSKPFMASGETELLPRPTWIKWSLPMDLGCEIFFSVLNKKMMLSNKEKFLLTFTTQLVKSAT
jgi:hypothetical protein